MDKIIMLGVGSGGTLDLYNTCFVIQNNQGPFLVDTGGGIETIKQLKQIGVEPEDVKNIFVSHSHTDHILGLIWIFKKIGRMAINGKIEEKIRIFCNKTVYEAIMGVSRYVLPPGHVEAIGRTVDFVILEDGDRHEINGVTYEFFDIMAKGTRQFGFECRLNGKRLVFLGDETLNPVLKERVRGADYVMHEAFCLDREENIFHAYEKHHATTLDVAKVMNGLGVKNLILYHTEDTHGDERKKLYTDEAKEVFAGNVIVPDELEEILV